MSATPSKASLSIPRTPSDKGGKSPGGLLRSAVHFLSSTPLLVSAALGFDLSNDIGGGGGQTSQGLGEPVRSTALASGTPYRANYNGSGNLIANGDTPVVPGGRATSRKVMFRDESLGHQLGDEEDEKSSLGGEGGRAAAAVRLLVEEREVDRYLGPDDIFDPHTEGIYKNRAARSLSRELKADAAAAAAAASASAAGATSSGEEKEAVDGGEKDVDIMMSEADDKIASAMAASAALEAAEALGRHRGGGGGEGDDENRNNGRPGKRATGKRSRKEIESLSMTENIHSESLSTSKSTNSIADADEDDKKSKASSSSSSSSSRSKRGRMKNEADIDEKTEKVNVQVKDETSVVGVRTRRGATAVAVVSIEPKVVQTENIEQLPRKRTSSRSNNSKGSSINSEELKSTKDSASMSISSSDSSGSLKNSARGGSKRKQTRTTAKSVQEDDVVVTQIQAGDIQESLILQSANPFAEVPIVKNGDKRKKRKTEQDKNISHTENSKDLTEFVSTKAEGDVFYSAHDSKRSSLFPSKAEVVDTAEDNKVKMRTTTNEVHKPMIVETQPTNAREEDMIIISEEHSPVAVPARDNGAGVGVHLLKSPTPLRAKQSAMEVEPEGLWEKSSKHLHEIISIIHTTFHPSGKNRKLMKELVSSRSVPVQDSAFRAVSSIKQEVGRVGPLSLQTSQVKGTPAQSNLLLPVLPFSPHGSGIQTAKSTLPFQSSSITNNSSVSAGGTPGRRLERVGSSLPYMRRKSAGSNSNLSFSVSAMGGPPTGNQGFGSYAQAPFGKESFLQRSSSESFQLIQDSISLQRSRFLNDSTAKPIESAESIANRILGALGQIHSPLLPLVPSNFSTTSIIGSGSQGQTKNEKNAVASNISNGSSSASFNQLTQNEPTDFSLSMRFSKTSGQNRAADPITKSATLQQRQANVQDESDRLALPSTSSIRLDSKVSQSSKKAQRDALSRSQVLQVSSSATSRYSLSATPVLASSEVFDFGLPQARPRVQITEEERKLIALVEEELF